MPSSGQSFPIFRLGLPIFELEVIDALVHHVMLGSDSES